MARSKSPAFYEAGSWYHRIKALQEDGTTKYSKKGGFTTAKEAEESHKKYEKQYQDAYRAYHIRYSRDFTLKEYLIYWLEEVFAQRVENSTKMLSSYVLYNLLLPEMTQDIKLNLVSVEYLDALLEKVAPICKSAGNKSRELLNMALKEAVVQGYISYNPVPATKPYRRTKVNMIVLNKEEIRRFLACASDNNWYLEILLGLFMGLRKGEILGLKFDDFNMESHTLTISRQITSNPLVEKGDCKILKYCVTEKAPKTENSYRTLKVPEAILEEVQKRKQKTEEQKQKLGRGYIDRNYISCAENGLPHSTSAFNNALTKLCRRNGFPHLTVHSLRHMYASILLEQGVPLAKISALLGHSSIHTTFEFYCEVMNDDTSIRDFMNMKFVPGGEVE